MSQKRLILSSPLLEIMISRLCQQLIENQDIVPGVVGGHINPAAFVKHHFMAVFDRVICCVGFAPVGIDTIAKIAMADSRVGCEAGQGAEAHYGGGL